jgi:multidrug resistance protein
MRNKPLTVLFVTIFLDLVAFGIVIPILPLYSNELGASGFMIGVIAASFSFMQFFFAPFWGNLSDRIGRRPVLLMSIAVIGVSYLIFAQANTIIVLLLSRMLAGIGAANISTANAFISDITPPENRSKNFGIVGAAFGLGFIFGPPLGGFLKDNFGIEWVGYVSAGLAAINFCLAYLLLPESLKEPNYNNSLIPNPFAEIKQMLPRHAIMSFLFSNFIFISAFSMMHITASLLWQEKYKLSEAEIGYVFAFIGIAVALVQGTLIGPLNKWIGARRLFISGSLLMAIGLLAMPFVPVALFIPLELLALLIIALGNGFFTPTVSSLISQQAHAKEQGMVMGLLQSVGSLSRVVGPIAGGTLYGIHYTLPYVTAAVMMLGVLVLAYFIVKKHLSPAL